MKLSTLCRGTDITVRQDVEINRLTDYAQDVQTGDAFVSIPGKNGRACEYIRMALERGAKAVITEENAAPPLYQTQNARKSLALMSANYYENPADALKMIGITGTNGKSTVTGFLRQILQEAGCRVGTIGTVENSFGSVSEIATHTTPEPLELHALLRRMQKSGVTHTVMEVSSQALAQYRVYGISFACAAFLNLSPEHLDYHGTMEAYYQAKKQLFDQCACAVIGTDSAYGTRLAKELHCPIVTFGSSENADYVIRDIQTDAKGTAFRLCSSKETLWFQTPFWGAYNLQNAVCALLCAKSVGIPLAQGGKALSHAVLPEGRLERLSSPPKTRIILDYAHTPEALAMVLQTLRAHCTGKLICLFGCGGDRDRQKRPEMGKIAARYSDRIFLTDDNPRTEPPQQILRDILGGIPENADCTVISDRTAAIARAIDALSAGDILLLAGKGHEHTQMIGKECRPFSEREIVAEILNKKEEPQKEQTALWKK